MSYALRSCDDLGFGHFIEIYLVLHNHNNSGEVRVQFHITEINLSLRSNTMLLDNGLGGFKPLLMHNRMAKLRVLEVLTSSIRYAKPS